jgi:hypothetical protein
MKKLLLCYLTITLILTSCRTLKSTTYIKANEAFVLGNNKHQAFNVKLKNASLNNLEVLEIPIAGGQHSLFIIKPNETKKVNVEKDTALRISNNNNSPASIELLVKGDIGLSMGYKN